MRQIKELAEHIREELSDAEKYAEMSNKYAIGDAKLAGVYKQIAKQELEHADMEHNEVVRLIKVAKDSGMVIPDVMQEVWNWEHDEMVKRVAEIKYMLDMAK